MIHIRFDLENEKENALAGVLLKYSMAIFDFHHRFRNEKEVRKAASIKKRYRIRRFGMKIRQTAFSTLSFAQHFGL